jgi:hypothetical protein
MKKFLLLALASAALSFAQSGSYTWEVGAQIMPSTATNICSDRPGAPPCGPGLGKTLHLARLVLVNTTVGVRTITITDNSTNCSAGVCKLFSATIPASPQTYIIDLGFIRANQGALWNADLTGVHAWLAGN